MTHVGHALIGDQVYGGRRRVSDKLLGAGLAARINAFPRQALHAAKLGFCHPVTGDDLLFSADLPEDMAALVHDLRAVTA